MSETKEESIKVPKTFSYGTGKRKNAIVKVWIFSGSGKVSVNNTSLIDHLKSEILVKIVHQPLELVELQNTYDMVIKAQGGGLVGQAYAIRHGLSRALENENAELRKLLKKAGFLTRDPRVKERKKYGRKKARKGFQYRKR